MDIKGKQMVEKFMAVILLALVLACTGCGKERLGGDGSQVSPEEVLHECLQSLGETASVHILAEQWYSDSKGSGVQNSSESFIVLPDKEHVIHRGIENLGPQEIVEEWRIGSSKYVRYGDGHIETSSNEHNGDSYSFPDIYQRLIDCLEEPVFLRREVINGNKCYVIEAKGPHDLKDINNGYYMVTVFIDEERFLLKRLILERYPIRYPNQPYDDSFKLWSDLSFENYNDEFIITIPEC